MATSTYKRLGAASGNGVIATGASVYAVPALTAAVVSTIMVTNQSATAATYSLGVSTSASYEASGMVVYQAAIAGNDTIALTFGMTLDATNKYVLASTSASTVNVQVFGSEIA